MPTAVLEIRGRRGPPDDPMAVARPQTECVVRARIVGDAYLNALATLSYDGRAVLTARQNLFHAFCRFAIGKAYRFWQQATDLPEAVQEGIELQLPVRVSTTEQNLLKSCLLTYLWTEPKLLGHGGELTDTLWDEFIVDYTGAPGTQPFIYFPPPELQTADDRLQALYERRILCRLSIQTDAGVIQRYFTSMVVPGLRAGELDPASERLWGEIKQRMLAALRKGTRPS